MAGVAEDDRVARHLAAHAPAGNGLHLARREVGGARRLGRVDDRLGERMLGAPFQRRRERQQPPPFAGTRRNDIRHGGPPLGQRPGLVDDQQIRLGEAFQRLGVAHQHARLGATPGRDHDRHRRRQPERAGTGDDQHAHRRADRVGKGGRRARRHPAERGERGDGDDGRHEGAGDPVGERLDRRAAALRLRHLGDDAGENRLGAHPLRPHDERAGLVERAPRQRIARPLLHRQGLAGEHALVDGGATLGHDAVHGHALARPQPEPVAGAHFLQRHVGLAFLREPARGAGCETHEGADGIARPLPRAGLHHLARQHEREDHRGRLEVGRRLSAGAEHGGRKCAGREQPRQAEEPGGAGAEGDQRPHVGQAVPHRRPPAQEEGAGDPQHRCRDQALQGDEKARPEPGVEGNARVAPHLQREDGRSERCREPQPVTQVEQLWRRPCIGHRHHRLERHAADRTIARRGLLDLGVHRAGVEAPLGRGPRGGAAVQEISGCCGKSLPAPGATEIEGAPAMRGRVAGAGALHFHAADGVARRRLAGRLHRCAGFHNRSLRDSRPMER